MEIQISCAALHVTNVQRCLEKPGGCHYAWCLPEDLRLGEMTQWAAVRGVFFFFFGWVLFFSGFGFGFFFGRWFYLF